MNLLTILLLGAVVAFVGGVVLFGPYYWDYLVMREITQAAVLEWYNAESQEAGKKRLQRELVKNDIPSYIDETHCIFDTDVDEDGLPNWLDLDADGDGILDQDEADDDDGDGIPDYLDSAIPTAWFEAGCGGCAVQSASPQWMLWFSALLLIVTRRRVAPRATRL